MAEINTNLMAYYKSLPNKKARESYVKRCGTTLGYLYHILHGRKLPSAEMALKLAENSNWVVTPHHLRPSVFKNPWDGLPAMRDLDMNWSVLRNTSSPEMRKAHE